MSFLQELVQKYGSYRQEKDGEELIFKCPKCGKRKFYINMEKLKSHCFVCSWSVRFPRLIKKAAGILKPKPKETEDLPIEIPGFDPRVQSMHGDKIAALQKRGMGRMDWFKLGWGESSDKKFEGRIIIPIRENGQIMSHVARSVDGRAPKELSGPNRSHFFYGYDYYQYHFTRNEQVILVEGIFDQIKIASFGFPCLALMGSSISDIQIGKLLKLKPSKVILMMDGDDAGRKATKTIQARLGKRMNPMNIQMIYLPEGKDPDQLSREEFLDFMRLL